MSECKPCPKGCTKYLGDGKYLTKPVIKSTSIIPYWYCMVCGRTYKEDQLEQYNNQNQSPA